MCSYCFVTDIVGVEKVLIDETRPPYVLLSLLNILNVCLFLCLFACLFGGVLGRIYTSRPFRAYELPSVTGTE